MVLARGCCTLHTHTVSINISVYTVHNLTDITLYKKVRFNCFRCVRYKHYATYMERYAYACAFFTHKRMSYVYNVIPLYLCNLKYTKIGKTGIRVVCDHTIRNKKNI